MYFFIEVEVGTFDLEEQKQNKMSLIVDTGSTLTAFPCKNYCTNCGNHLDEYFALDDSKTKEIIRKDSYTKCEEKEDNK